MGGIVFLIFDTISVIISGFALKLMWGWFVVTAFNMPTLTFVSAMGICLVVRVIARQHIPMTDEELGNSGLISVLLPIYLLAFGFVVHLFM